MSEALSKQAIELGALLPRKARASENVLDLLSEIAGDGAYGRCSGPLSNSAAMAVALQKAPYPENDSRRYVGQVLVYSCASPAVLAILQTLSDMFS